MGVYMLLALSTITAFEIRKARCNVKISETRLLVPPDSALFKRLKKLDARRGAGEARRLPFISAALLSLIFLLAIPLFFIAPRWQSSALARTNGGLAGFIGFSDNVQLGDIGRLQQSDKLVMRVRVESQPVEDPKPLRWRGVALDEFTGTGWHRSPAASRFEEKTSDSNFFQVDVTDRESLNRLTTQTFFVEPVDTPVLFAAPRAIAVQAGAKNLYDAAKAIEAYLRDENNFRYSLDLRAGGADPLADFLFKVRAGHCEYFSTAMAVMLRTQGIATRVVNGFQAGDYNET